MSAHTSPAKSLRSVNPTILLSTVSAVSMLVYASGPATAQCTPNPNVTGEIICAGTITTPQTISQDDVDVVLPATSDSISVSGATSALTINGSGNALQNVGTIQQVSGGVRAVSVNSTGNGFALNNSGLIESLAANDAVFIDSVGFPTTIMNSGTIRLAPSNTSVVIEGVNVAADAGVTFRNTGTVSHAGAGSAVALSTSGEEIVFTNANNATIENISRYAVSLSHTGTSDGINFENAGDIISTGSGSFTRNGVFLEASTADISVRNEATGKITSGSVSPTLQALSGDGDVRVTNLGELIGGGLVAQSTDGDVVVVNEGDLSGGNVYGETEFGSLLLQNSGRIAFTGPTAQFASGAFIAESGVTTDPVVVRNLAGGVITGDHVDGIAVEAAGPDILNAGEITVTANGTGTRMPRGIYVEAEGDATIENTGTITSVRNGIFVEALQQNAALSITNSGTIDNASGSAVEAYGNGVTTFVNATSGVIRERTGTSAVYIARDQRGGVNFVNNGLIDMAGVTLLAGGGFDNSGTITTVVENAPAVRIAWNDDYDAVNSGQITTQGDGAVGVSFTGGERFSDFEFRNTGEVSTVGGAAHALEIAMNAADGTEGLDVINTATGTIRTQGDGADAIVIGGADMARDTLIRNQGTITTMGGVLAPMSGDPLSADGIVLDQAASTGRIENSGQLTASGDGVVLSNMTSTAAFTISNGGTIDAGSGGTGTALNLASLNTVAVTNAVGGTIQGVAGAITLMGGGSTDFTLTSNGDIVGTVDLQASADTVELLDGSIDAVSLGALDDSLTFGSRQVDIGGVISGGTGTDTLTFAPTTPFVTTATFADFEVVSMDRVITLDGAMIGGAQTTSILETASISVTANGTQIDGSTTLSGNMTLAPESVLSVGALTAASGSTLTLQVDADAPSITATGDITFDEASAIEIDVRDINTISSGRTFDAASAGGMLTDNSGNLVDNSELFFFTKEVVGGQILRITAEQEMTLPDVVPVGDLAILPIATELQAIIDAGGGDGTRLSTLFGQLSDDAAVLAGIQAFLPDASGAVAASQINLMRHVLRTDGNHSEVGGVLSARSPWHGAEVWGQILLGDASGDAEDVRPGYSASWSGFVLGADYPLLLSGYEARVGISAHVLSADATSEGASNADLDAENIGVGLYGEISIEGWEFEAELRRGGFDGTNVRGNDLLGEIVSAPIEGSQWGISSGLSYPLTTGQWELSPRGDFSWISAKIDGYTDDQSIAALTIADQTVTHFEISAGMRAGTRYDVSPDVILYPVLSADLVHRSADADDISATVSGGMEQILLADATRSGTGIAIGLGGDADLTNAVSVGLRYEGEWLSEETSHGFQLSVQGRF